VALAVKWVKDNPDRKKRIKDAYYARNKEKLLLIKRQARIEKREKYLEGRRRHYAKHAEHYRKKNRERRRTERLCPTQRLNDRIGGLLRFSLGAGKKGRSWTSILPYTVEQLRVHIERQFKRDMSWDNMERWHIDHIIPRSSFSFTCTEDDEFKACWALSNLRPMWAKDNIKKHNKRLTLL
jgi:hypothetical protein